MRGMKMIPILLVASLLCACRTTPDKGDVMAAEIERQVAVKLKGIRYDQYARYYAASAKDEILAVFLFSGDTKDIFERPGGKRYWVQEDQLPKVTDGGCSVINVTYNIKIGRVREASCQGGA
jgi:hypothetical protein